MEEQWLRTRALIGEEGLRILANSWVALFGLGGVGSFTAEVLARCGVGRLTLVDYDVVTASNLNRQLLALHSTVGKLKVEVMKERILDINPSAYVTTFPTSYNRETTDRIISQPYDYVVDAIDSVNDKLLLLQTCREKGIPVISCMGTGYRMNPSLLAVGDIRETSRCPLARKIRRGLRQAGIEGGIKVVYSREDPRSVEKYPGVVPSMALVPPAAGIMMAAEVVRDLLTVKGGVIEGRLPGHR